MYIFFDLIDNNFIYNKNYRWVPREFSFNKTETKANLEASLNMFWN